MAASKRPADAQSFAEITNVSRETLSRLEVYADLLTHWTRRINLIAPRSVPDLWARHMLDSAQIVPHLPEHGRSLMDLGSGAGFPGLVVAAMRNDLKVALTESDGRKCAFLREAAREMGLSAQVEIVEKRIEDLPKSPPVRSGLPVDIITARALSSLSQLLSYSFPLCHNQSRLLFLKGKRFSEELTEAKSVWHINLTRIDSITDPDGCLISIKGFRHVCNDSREDAQVPS